MSDFQEREQEKKLLFGPFPFLPDAAAQIYSKVHPSSPALQANPIRSNYLAEVSSNAETKRFRKCNLQKVTCEM